jgi:hypothetical protein
VTTGTSSKVTVYKASVISTAPYIIHYEISASVYNRSCIGVAGIEHVSAGVLDQKLGLAYIGESLLYCPDLFVLVGLQYQFPPGLEASNLIQQGCPGLEEGEMRSACFLSWVGGIGMFQNRTGCIEQAPCDFFFLYLPEAAFMEIF